MAVDVGAGTVDMSFVQVHPTGLVDPKEPDAKVKWLAAEALRGSGAILLDGNGARFCNELGKRDYVSGKMLRNKGPYRLVMNSKQAAEFEWCVLQKPAALSCRWTPFSRLSNAEKFAPAALRALPFSTPSPPKPPSPPPGTATTTWAAA